MNPIRVLLVDDLSCVRVGVRSLLEDVEGFEVVGETGREEEVLLLASLCTPDVVLLDFDPDNGSGFALLDALAEHGFQGKVVVWSLRGGASLQKRVEEHGAGAFLEKGVAPSDLLRTLHHMAGRSGLASLDDPPPRRVVWRPTEGRTPHAA
ncbi:MAG: response regulator [Chloroflexi bacterium]|nr:response regulator [Chloroflexota bacterium]